MANVSGGLLAAETCRAGALGFLAAGHLASLEELNREIFTHRTHFPDGPLCIGFIGRCHIRRFLLGDFGNEYDEQGEHQ